MGDRRNCCIRLSRTRRQGALEIGAEMESNAVMCFRLKTASYIKSAFTGEEGEKEMLSR